MTGVVLDRTIDRETEEVVSFAPRTLLKRHPWSAGSSQRPRARAAAEIQPFETTDPDAPCVGKYSRLVSNVAPLCHRSASYFDLKKSGVAVPEVGVCGGEDGLNPLG